MTVLILPHWTFAMAAPPLPSRPPPPAPVEDECPKPIGLDVGARVPGSLVASDRVVACAAVALPVSQYLDLHQTEVWATACADQYGIVTAGFDVDMANTVGERDEWKALALERKDDLQRAERWYRQPAVNMALGAGAMLLAVGLGVAL